MSETEDKDVLKIIKARATPETWTAFRKQFLNFLVSKEIDYVIDYAEDKLEQCNDDQDELRRRKRYRK